MDAEEGVLNINIVKKTDVVLWERCQATILPLLDAIDLGSEWFPFPDIHFPEKFVGKLSKTIKLNHPTEDLELPSHPTPSQEP